MSTRPAVRMVGTAWSLHAALARINDYLTLTKARLSLLVLAATLTGILLGSDGPVDVPLLVHTLLGTALVAWGAGALNQMLERDADARMHRTLDRPIPAGRMSVDEALYFGVASAVVGTIYLIVATNLAAAALAAATVLLYVAIYTPLKRVTTACLFAGAVPGAIPPLIGFAAAHGSLTYAAWLPALLVFFWQYPHFLAISWLYREDYARGGFAMLAVRDPEGGEVGRQVVGRSLLMVIASLLPAACGACGAAYAWTALASGVLFIAMAVDMARKRDPASARRLFHASLVYLPLLMTMMVVNRLG